MTRTATLDRSGVDLSVLGLGASLPTDPYTSAFTAIAQAVEGISQQVVPIAAGFGDKNAQAELAQNAATAAGAQQSALGIAQAQAQASEWSSLALPLGIAAGAVGLGGLLWWLS